MLTQKGFGGETPRIINPSEPHMACLLLLDTSGSMSGDPIANLNEAINVFKSEVLKDEKTRNIVDIAIVEFNDETNIVQEFVPIEQLNPVELHAGGTTEMGDAILTAINMVDARSKFYYQTGTVPYKPWIVMISDGGPTDDITEAVKKIKDHEESGKVKVFALGVEGYDPQTLHRLAGKKVMRLQGYSFEKFFDWLNKSMRNMSKVAPGETPKAEPLPEDVDKDTTEFWS